MAPPGEKDAATIFGDDKNVGVVFKVAGPRKTQLLLLLLLQPVLLGRGSPAFG